MSTIITLEAPSAEASMLEVRQQAEARGLFVVVNKRADIRLCSTIPRGWRLHRIHIKDGRAAA